MQISQMHSCHFYWDRRVPLAQRCTGEPNQQSQQDIFHSVSHPWNSQFQHAFTKLIFFSEMQHIPHVSVVILRWFLCCPCHWLFDWWLFNSRPCAGRRIGINRTTFQKLHLLKLCKLSLLRLGVLLWSNKRSLNLIELLIMQKISGWFYPLIFYFSIADIHQCYRMWLPPLDRVTA